MAMQQSVIEEMFQMSNPIHPSYRIPAPLQSIGLRCSSSVDSTWPELSDLTQPLRRQYAKLSNHA